MMQGESEKEKGFSRLSYTNELLVYFATPAAEQ